MRGIFILAVVMLVLTIEAVKWQGLREDGLCQGNHFLFLSTYVLGRQQDLTKTFTDINKTAKIDEIVYQDQPFRTYRIFNMTQNITYQQGRQGARLKQNNVLQITNGTLRINYHFNWEKIQLGSSIFGTGTGTVGSDKITYQKTLSTNTTHELQWHLSQSQPVTITNGLSLATVSPYRKNDYQILSNMLNKLKTGQPTAKDYLLKTININYQSILSQKVIQDQTLKFDKSIQYNYFDYRGNFTLTYSQTLMNSTLASDGLYLLFSQVIDNYPDFQCGQPVPQIPDDPMFGGLQQFISNSLIKSTLRYALQNKKLDVKLNQQFWQSRAFQFFIGDVHEVMPSSTKNMSSMIQLEGRCDGLDDPVFSFATKTTSSYQVKVNFACTVNFDTTKLLGVNIVVDYEVQPKLGKYLDFSLKMISGIPAFVQSGNFKIEYQELAQFMVAQTMKIALDNGGKVIGSGYRAEVRKFPGIWVKQNYLFLYDSSVKPKGIFSQTQRHIQLQQQCYDCL